mmetsp:Transcript_7893/g.8703  ORF Transcript_7893/g.8703 Transcript_7893/m.8703 type:complete len:283 (+) Transcript_7893:105-953(+)
MSDFISSIKDKFNAFSDEQRQERLKQCMDIKVALDECIRVSNNQMKQNEESISNVSGNQNRWGNNAWKKWKKSEDSSHTAKGKNETQKEETLKPNFTLEDSRAGMKISRFYGWGLSNRRAEAAIASMRDEGEKVDWDSLRKSSTESSNNSKTDNTKFGNNNESNFDDTTPSFPKAKVNDTDIGSGKASTCSSSQSCLRENHALWACRAMSLGCASDLVQLKKCIERKSTGSLSSLHYDDGSNDSNKDEDSLSFCRIEQKQVGDCVTTNWKELIERMNRRKKS